MNYKQSSSWNHQLLLLLFIIILAKIKVTLSHKNVAGHCTQVVVASRALVKCQLYSSTAAAAAAQLGLCSVVLKRRTEQHKVHCIDHSGECMGRAGRQDACHVRELAKGGLGTLSARDPLTSSVQWRRNEFESGGLHVRREFFWPCPSTFLSFWWTLSWWPVQFGQFLVCCSTHGAPVPWSRHHWLCVLYIGYRSNRNAVLCCPQNLNKALKQKRKKRPRNVLAVSAISIWTALAAETFRCFISRIVRRLTETKHFRRLETKYVLLFYFNCAGTIGRKRLRYRSNCGRYSPVTDTSHY